MNPLLGLNQRGQFVWLDHISRSLIRGGELQRLIDQDGLGGVTSNPTIFEKAIAGSNDYDAELQRVLDAEPNIDNRTLAERLVVEDLRWTADALRPVYDKSKGANGCVSLEVSPRSAHDTDATIAEARHLWQVAARPNVMITVPAAPHSWGGGNRTRTPYSRLRRTSASTCRDHRTVTADGLTAFASSFARLLAAVADKRRWILTTAS